MRPLRQTVIDRYAAIFLALTIILIAYSGLILHKNIMRIDEDIKYQEKALKLAHEMENASNKLTDLARSFINGYNIKDLSEYFQEINIVKTKENVISQVTSMNIPEEESYHLKKAKEKSDALEEIEIHAMVLIIEAMKYKKSEIASQIAGHTLPTDEYNLSKEEKLKLAEALVFGDEYRNQKKEIRYSISQYRKITENRISDKLNMSIKISNDAFNLHNIFLVFLLVGGFVILLFYYTQIALPVRKYTTIIEDYSGELGLPKLIPKGSLEIYRLAEAFNKNAEEKEKFEASLKETEYKLKLHIHLMPLAAIEYDNNFNITHWNKAAEKIFGYSKEEAVGKSFIKLIVPIEIIPEVQEIISKLRSRDKGGEIAINKNTTKDGRIIMCEWYNTPIFDPYDNVIGWLSLGKDITKERQEQDRVLYLSQHDPLTKLYNRGFIMEQLEMENARFKRTGIAFSVIILDIDFFKKVNDNYGHECGDEVLKKVAKIMTETVRQTDFVGRWGGEEFVILLPFTDTKGAFILAEKIRKNIEDEDLIYKDELLKITVTAGVSCCCKADSVTDCIRTADEALLQGKATGRNKVVVTKCFTP